MANYDFKDLAVDNNMDLIIENGDLKIEEDPMALARVVSYRVVTEAVESPDSPYAVAGIKRFVGSVNNSDLQERIKTDITNALAVDAFISLQDVLIEFLKVENNPNAVKIVITLSNMSYTNLDGVEKHNQSVTCRFSLDTMSGKLTFIDDLF